MIHLIIKERENYSDWAILYRNNKDAENIWGQLIGNKIPFKVSKFGILKDKKVRFLTVTMKMIFFDNWELTYEFICWLSQFMLFEFSWNMIDALNKKRKDLLYYIFVENDKCKNIFNELYEIDDRKNMKKLIQIIKKLRSFQRDNLSELAKEILNMFEDIKNERILQFINWIEYIQKYSPYQDSMEILMNLEGLAENPKGLENIVTLSTIHKAKGLEWKNVVIVNFDKIKDEDKGDDKNLAYVASSRAKYKLFLLNI